VREQRIVADAHRLGPVVVAEGAVRGDTQHLGIGLVEVADALIEGRHALASAGRPIERIEQDDDVLVTIVTQAHVLHADGLQRERRGLVTDVERFLVGHGAVPLLATLRVARVMIAPSTGAAGRRTGAGGLRASLQSTRRRASSGAVSTPRCEAAVTTRPVLHSDSKRVMKPGSRSAWWSMMTRQPVASSTRCRCSIPRCTAPAGNSRSIYDGGPDRYSSVGRCCISHAAATADSGPCTSDAKTKRSRCATSLTTSATTYPSAVPSTPCGSGGDTASSTALSRRRQPSADSTLAWPSSAFQSASPRRACVPAPMRRGSFASTVPPT